MSIGQRVAKFLSVKFEKNSNLGGVKLRPQVFVHTLAVMAEVAG